AKNDDLKSLGLTAILEDALSNCQNIPFMAIDNEGQKAIVILLGIQVFFDILVPNGESPDNCETKVRGILSGSKVKTLKIEQIKAFPFRSYHTEKKTYLRIYTSGTGKRKTAMKAIQDNNYETASDDLYSFHRKVARENRIQLSGWSMLNFCPLKDFTKISDQFPTLALLRDRTLVFTWDIETQSQELDDPKSLKQICLINIETEPDSQRITIICGNQVNLLKAFVLCWRAFASDIQVGLTIQTMIGISLWKEPIILTYSNGCGRAKSENNFKKGKKKNTDEEETIWGSSEEIKKEKDFMGAIKIKITAEENFFFKVEKEVSLKFFLKKCGFDAKADMPYDEIWRIYSEAKEHPSSITGKKMHKVANYCIIDALRCQELLVKLSQINDYREGIESRRPVTGLDFASLYPSLIMAYNLSPDKIILTHREADIAEKNGNILYKIEFPFNNRTDLFNKRVELKAHLAQLGKKKLQLAKIISSAKKRGKRILESLNSEYSFVCFDYDYFNSKQRALKMTYEKVLFPVCFTGKKKYFSIPHEEVINFRSDGFFMRGIDTVKQVNSKLFRFIGEKFMWEAISIINTRSIHEIVEDAF
ncbi:17687_t:CDS:2, partial [Funneliformis geosporum]